MTVAKVQHYVPQFLLRNFGNGKKDQVWVYDKTCDRAFPTNAKNIASESRFYDFEHEGEQVTLEPFLSRIESRTKPVVESILESDSLRHLTAEDKDVLITFLSIQLTRTRTFREEWSEFPRILRKHIQAKGEVVAPGSQAAQLLLEPTENEAKTQTGMFMVQAPEMFGQHFAQKEWVLAATTRRHPFLMSDNPLVRQNLNDLSPRGNLGLTTPGIELYLPLSPTRALAMWCTSLTERVRHGAQSLLNNAVQISPSELRDPTGVIALSEALTTGRPVSYSKENVDNFNSLQIAWSERYVFSSVDDFQLAKQLVHSNPMLRRGPRSQVG